MNKNKYLFNVIPLLFIFLAGTVSAFGKELSTKELEKIFSGHTAFGRHISKNLNLIDYFATNGEFTSVRSNGQTYTGKWWVSKKRAALCIRYKHKPKHRYCRAIVKGDKGGYNRVRQKDGKLLVHYDKIIKGDKTKK